MAKCKCRLCKAELDTKEAYKVIIKDRPAYFCNYTHYEEFDAEIKKQEKAKELKEKFYNLFCEILGVKGITNTALFKEKSEINKVFTDDVIVSFLEKNKEWIRDTVSRLSGGEYGRIRYVSAILKNRLGDFKPKVERQVIVDKSYFEFFEPTMKEKEIQEECILDDVEDELL